MDFAAYRRGYASRAESGQPVEDGLTPVGPDQPVWLAEDELPVTVAYPKPVDQQGLGALPGQPHGTLTVIARRTDSTRQLRAAVARALRLAGCGGRAGALIWRGKPLPELGVLQDLGLDGPAAMGIQIEEPFERQVERLDQQEKDRTAVLQALQAKRRALELRAR